MHLFGRRRDWENPEQNDGPRGVVGLRDNFHIDYTAADRNNLASRDKREPHRRRLDLGRTKGYRDLKLERMSSLRILFSHCLVLEKD